ncbi:type I methionyl aminopeptidase [Candidatus Poriferisodalis sp.]|uniref:type I methionyl aminopeptidase n=1 Tax=Candidatus Poriferisodalis sp. TaxID=3101277 RepID=UPI003B020860
MQLAQGTTVDAMRRAGSAARRVLAQIAAEIAPGVTTDWLDEVCHHACIAEGGYPSPLGYPGPHSSGLDDGSDAFPKSLCTSVNEVICHGIPDDRPLRDGDIVNCDVTIYLGGVHGDHSETFLVGEADEASRRLVEVTREAMYHGIASVRPGAEVRDIGRAIQARAEAEGYGVIREFIGHGVGQVFHSLPNIPHYYDAAARTALREGMTFTVEPMIAMVRRGGGSVPRVGKIWSDHWTAPTADGSRTAQFEHTVLVTDDGAELLTVEDDEPQPFRSGDVANKLDSSTWPRQLSTAGADIG